MTTLFHTCVQFVSNNLQDYDLEDFPDEFVIKYVSIVQEIESIIYNYRGIYMM